METARLEPVLPSIGGPEGRASEQACDAEVVCRSANVLRSTDPGEVDRFLLALGPEERLACTAFCHCVVRDLAAEGGAAASSRGACGGDGGAELAAREEEILSRAVSQVLHGLEGEMKSMKSSFDEAIGELRASLLGAAAVTGAGAAGPAPAAAAPPPAKRGSREMTRAASCPRIASPGAAETRRSALKRTATAKFSGSRCSSGGRFSEDAAASGHRDCHKPGYAAHFGRRCSELPRKLVRSQTVVEQVHYTDSNPWEHFVVEAGKVGEGSFGTVHLGRHRETSYERAIKKVPKSVMDRKTFWKEVDILKRLDHPQVLRLFATYEDTKYFYVVTDYCAGGELFDAVVDHEFGFTEKIVARLMKQMLTAVDYLHTIKICHRDLKPENFMLSTKLRTKTDIESVSVKVIDFNSARCFADGRDMLTKICSVHYVAPEILSRQEKPYTELVDIWSMGVVMFLLLCGQAPFQGRDDMSIMKAVKKGKYKFEPLDVWGNVSLGAKDLVEKMLELNPLKRYSAKDTLGHIWVTELAPESSGAVLLTLALVSRLRAFISHNKLKKLALQVIAQNISDEHIEDLKRTFVAIDGDNSGSLQVDEIEAAIHESAMESGAAAELTGILHDMAAGSDGEVNYTQFLGATIDRRYYLQEGALRAAFACFDADGDGVINREELATVLGCADTDDMATIKGSIGEQLRTVIGDGHELDQILKEVDKDGDGEINFDEFMSMMQNMPA